MSFVTRAIVRGAIPLAGSLLAVACATCAPTPCAKPNSPATPEVAAISTGELANWLADGSRPPPLALDVRTAAEHAVSHLL